jgi:hypothetical protein
MVVRQAVRCLMGSCRWRSPLLLRFGVLKDGQCCRLPGALRTRRGLAARANAEPAWGPDSLAFRRCRLGDLIANSGCDG